MKHYQYFLKSHFTIPAVLLLMVQYHVHADSDI